MENEDLISAEDFSVHHNIEISFISSLHEYGLIETTTIEERRFIRANDLPQLEKFIHLHYDMDINIEGIEAINNLLERINNMQHELRQLRNKLFLYEG
jgi:pyridoxine 5'-phosphate synthase PdxJ